MPFKFENFKDPRFPLYCSTQRGTGQLAVPHYHNAYELIKILDGEVTAYIDTGEYVMRRGEMVFIPSQCIHATYSRCPDTVTFNVTFEKELIAPSLWPSEADEVLGRDTVTDHVFSALEYEELDRCTEDIRRVYYDGSPTYEMDALAGVYRLISCVFGRYRTTAVCDDGTVRIDRLRPVFEYIREHASERIRLCDLSNILHVCDDHLIRLFKTYTNKSPMQYIIDRRVENAMRLLITTDLSVADIATRTGFSSPNYMAKIFRDTIKLTPHQYRNRKQAH